MKPNFATMTQEERNAHKAKVMAERTNEWKSMTTKQVAKMETRNMVVAESNETHYEMLLRNAKQNLPSSLR